MGKGAAESIFRPTVNLGTIRSNGAKVNMDSFHCNFEVHIRLPNGHANETILAEINCILTDFPQASYDVREAATNASAASPRDHELVELLQANTELVHGERPLPISSLGAMDCKHFRYNSVPAYSYGPSPGRDGRKRRKSK